MLRFAEFSRMPEPELSLLFIRPLNLAGFRYAVSGSVAAIMYGEPRLTHDVDLLVFLNEQNIKQLSQIFPTTDFYVPPAEVIAAEVSREKRGHFNIIHVNTGFKADFYPTGRDEMNAWAFRKRRSVQFEGETVMVAPPEYVIASKLEYFREGGSEKHVRDIRSMLAVSGDRIDKSELNEWIQRRGVQEQWRKIQS